MTDDATFVAFDLETTGLSRVDDRIVEIGAVRFDANGRELATFERLVNPLRPSHPRARAVHGIPDEILAKAEMIDVVLPDFFAFLGKPDDLTLMAHNAGFDAGFVGAEAARIGLPTPGYSVVDTLPIARKTWPELSTHRLDHLALRLGLDPHGPHRALADSRRVKGLWLAMSGLHRDRPAVIYPIHDPSGPVPAPRGWDRLVDAVERGVSIRVVYEGGRRGETPREITPKRFVQRGGVAYVACLCHIDFKEKDFRLDRVRSYEVLG